eukprot:m.45424 g.45424  ORF g.45424 m.45424 type:complete len:1130 (-) comp10879_c1_seq2:213-3602(-)
MRRTTASMRHACSMLSSALRSSWRAWSHHSTSATTAFVSPSVCAPLSILSHTPLAAMTTVQTRRHVHSCIEPPPASDELRLFELLTWFRERGHMVADLDPLGRIPCGVWRSESAAYQPQLHHDSVEKLLIWLIQRYPSHSAPEVRRQWLASVLNLSKDAAEKRVIIPQYYGREDGNFAIFIEHLFDRLVSTYCGTLSCQFSHLPWNEQAWIFERLENRKTLTGEHRRGILQSLMRTTMFEEALGTHFQNSKRFSIEGCEAVIPGLDTLIRRSSELGVSHFNIGMPHRGRLAVLHTLMGQSFGQICLELNNQQSQFHVGDVKYHLGQTASIRLNSNTKEHIPYNPKQLQGADDNKVYINLVPNPSHLEAITPVVLGQTHAQQNMLKDDSRTRVLPVVLHGDAAFSGLGVVHESLQLSRIPGYSTGGCVHIVINNQIGYTTEPQCSRSSPHATDVAKAAHVPIFRANADDPEAVAEACFLAAQWRAEFASDVVVDVVGYRRHGHNEQDDPVPTHPLTYDLIRNQPRVVDKYQQQCLQRLCVSESTCDAWKEELTSELQQEYDTFKAGGYRTPDVEYAKDLLMASGVVEDRRGYQEQTGLPLHTLQLVGRGLTRYADRDINLHPSVRERLNKRRKMFDDEKNRVDWATAEALAITTLSIHRTAALEDAISVGSEEGKINALQGLNRGRYRIRLAGQDSVRGTFNQRQTVISNQTTGQQYNQFNDIFPGYQEPIEVYNSPLNEYASLGFEYGASIGYGSNALVMWEAQFGDFANNGQAIIDLFIASSEDRWGQSSSMVLLLPHGFDGQGPDHSSGRVERFLQLMNDDPDYLPGRDPKSVQLIHQVFDVLGNDKDQITRNQLEAVLKDIVDSPAEAWETIMAEIGLSPQEKIDRDSWVYYLMYFFRRHGERNANMIVANCTTPAQYFHLLRRHANLPYSKPLVVFTPKYLLHHKPCTSALSEFTAGNFFHRVIADSGKADNTKHHASNPVTGEQYLRPNEDIKRLVICTGQIYYKLNSLRRSLKCRDVSLVRLEQIAPFPYDKVVHVIKMYPNAEVVWCQEEPKNMGAWFYVQPRLATALRDLQLRDERVPVYVGRPVSASVATASSSIHREEERDIVHRAIDTSIGVDRFDSY